jgi:arsenate reductase (thioredoxin)
MMQRVLFICTHNSARSQMAEAFLRYIAGDRFEVASAGTEATRINPLAIDTMARRGISLESHRSKSLQPFLRHDWDWVVTVCDDANEACPVFPGGKHRLHWSFPDPSAVQGSEEHRRKAFEQAARSIEARLREWLAGASTASYRD